MKIVFIGGGSFSTPGLFQYLASAGAQGLEVLLAGRSAEKVTIVEQACKLLAREAVTVRTEVIGTNNWKQILDGADCVILQIRVGGFDGRLFDETFPHKYGLPGDEGLGASGLSVGWRTWPVVFRILEAISEFCPRAFVILLTSPLSLLVRAAKHSSLTMVGICELPWTTLGQLGLSLGRSTDDFTADYFGVNHLGWFFNVRPGSKDLMDSLAMSENGFPTAQFVREKCCFPLRYLRLHYEPGRVLIEQQAEGMPRADALRQIEKRAYDSYRSQNLSQITSALSARNTSWYSHAVGPLLLALSGRTVTTPFFLSKANGTYCSLFAADDIFEYRHEWINGQLQPVSLSGDPPAHVSETLQPFIEFERIAAKAIFTRQRPLLLEALSVHPWTRGHPQLQCMADEIARTNDDLMAKSGQIS
jgi:6-phospho-beta-glucosidase